MNKRLALLLSCFVLCSAKAREGHGQLLGALEIRGIDNLASAVFDLSKAIGQPVPKEMVSLGLYGVLGSMPGMGIEANGTLRAVWFAGEAEYGSLVVVIPVDGNGDEYLSSLGQSGWSSEPGAQGGIVKLTAPDSTFLPWRELFVLRQGSVVVAGKSEQDVLAGSSLLGSLPPVLPAEGVVAKLIRPSAIVDAFRPQIGEAMDTALHGGGAGSSEAIEVAQAYVNGYLALAEQIDEIALGIGIADGNMNLHGRLAPVKGSLIAQWMGTVGSPSPATAVVNLPGALFVETANLGNIDLLADPYFKFLENMLGAFPEVLGAENFKSYFDGLRQSWAQFNGDFGIALLPPTRQNPLRMAEYAALKDPSAVRGQIAPLVANANRMIEAAMAMEDGAPVAISLSQEEAREYKGIPVDRLRYRIQPGEEVQAFWPADRAIDIELELAWLPNGVLAGIGGTDITETLIDRALGGNNMPVESLDAWKAFYPTPDRYLVDATHIAAFDALRTYLALFDSVSGEESAKSIPDGPGNVASLSYLAMDGLMTRVKIGLGDIAAVAAKLQEVQQKEVQSRQENFVMPEGEWTEDEINYDEVSFEEWDHEEVEETEEE